MDVIIVSVFVSSEVDRYLDLQSPHTKNSQIGICGETLLVPDMILMGFFFILLWQHV
jgi:hypothetical protein